MDPVVIVGLVDASIGLALKCAGAVQRINDIASKYRNSRYTLMSIRQSLDTMQYAWERIGIWTESYTPDTNVDDDEFVERMARILATGTLVMNALDEDLIPFSEAGIGFMQRAKFIWIENTFLDHQNRIRDQAASMSLLLQAIQLQVPPDRGRLIRRAEQQFQKSDESAYSIVPSQMSSRLSISTCHPDGRESILSEEGIEYRQLSFEDDLFTARAYKRNYRTPLLPRLRKNEPYVASSTITPIEASQHATKGQTHNDKSDTFTGPIQEIRSIQDRDDRGRPGQQPHDMSFARHSNCVDEVTERKNTKQFSTNPLIASETNPEKPKERETFNALSTGLSSYQVSQRTYSLNANSRRDCMSGCDQGSYASVLRSLSPFPNSLLNTDINIAVIRGSIEVVRMLLQHGAFIEDREPSYGSGPLHLAAQMGNALMVKFLLDKGAKIGAENQLGEQPIHLAAWYGLLVVLRVLIDRGAALDCPNKSGFQPLHYAVKSGDQPVVIALLVNGGADIEACTATRPGERALNIACRLDLPKSVRTLLALGAVTNSPSRPYTDPLYTAIKHGSLAALEELLKYGVSPIWEEHFGTTALHLALDRASNELAAERSLQLLLRYRVDVDAQDGNGDTALHKVARQDTGPPNDSKVQLAKILLEHGADFSAINKQGRTPLYLATEGNRHKLSKLLAGKGARILIQSDGHTLSLHQQGVAGLQPLKATQYELQWHAPPTEYTPKQDRTLVPIFRETVYNLVASGIQLTSESISKVFGETCCSDDWPPAPTQDSTRWAWDGNGRQLAPRGSVDSIRSVASTTSLSGASDDWSLAPTQDSMRWAGDGNGRQLAVRGSVDSIRSVASTTSLSGAWGIMYSAYVPGVNYRSIKTKPGEDPVLRTPTTSLAKSVSTKSLVGYDQPRSVPDESLDFTI